MSPDAVRLFRRRPYALSVVVAEVEQGVITAFSFRTVRFCANAPAGPVLASIQNRRFLFKCPGWSMYPAVGAQGIVAKDWAFPGRQTTPPELVTAAADPVDEKRSGPVTEYARVQEPGEVRAGVAELTGLYSDGGVDANGDGLFEALRVTVGVT